MTAHKRRHPPANAASTSPSAAGNLASHFQSPSLNPSGKDGGRNQLGNTDLLFDLAGCWVETSFYFIYYFFAPPCLVYILEQIPSIRVLPSLFVQVFAGGFANCLWFRFFSSGHPSQLEMVARQLLNARKSNPTPGDSQSKEAGVFRLSRLQPLMQFAGILLGLQSVATIFGFLTKPPLNMFRVKGFRQTALSFFLTLPLPLPLLPAPWLQHDTLFPNLKTLKGSALEGAGAAFNAESFPVILAIFLFEFGCALLHNLTLRSVGPQQRRFRAVKTDTHTHFVSALIVMATRAQLATRPALNTSVAIIAAALRPEFLPFYALLALADLCALGVAHGMYRSFKAAKDPGGLLSGGSPFGESISANESMRSASLTTAATETDLGFYRKAAATGKKSGNFETGETQAHERAANKFGKEY